MSDSTKVEEPNYIAVWCSLSLIGRIGDHSTFSILIGLYLDWEGTFSLKLQIEAPASINTMLIPMRLRFFISQRVFMSFILDSSCSCFDLTSLAYHGLISCSPRGIGCPCYTNLRYYRARTYFSTFGYHLLPVLFLPRSFTPTYKNSTRRQEITPVKGK